MLGPPLLPPSLINQVLLEGAVYPYPAMSQYPTGSLAPIEDSTLYEGVYIVRVIREELCGDEQSQVSATAVYTSTRR
jgi:hypothetical protein